MSTPRTASTTDARKRLAEQQALATMTPAGGHAPDVAPPSGVGSEREAATAPPAGLPGYFVALDGFGADVVWRGTGRDDPTCRPVLEGWRVQATAPDLWAAIVALVEGGPR